MSLLRLHTESTSQPADVTDDSCTLKYIEIVPLTTDAEDRCTAVSDREDWSSDDYEQGLLPVVKQEPDDCEVSTISCTSNDAMSDELDEPQSHMEPIVVLESLDLASLMRKHYVRISINTRLLQVDDDSDDNYNDYKRQMRSAKKYNVEIATSCNNTGTSHSTTRLSVCNNDHNYTIGQQFSSTVSNNCVRKKKRRMVTHTCSICKTDLNSGALAHTCHSGKRNRHFFTHHKNRLNSLNLHKRADSAESFCDKKSSHSSRRADHRERAHSDDKFSCSVCQQRFRWFHCLKNHMRVHSDEKFFSCSVCQQRFRWFNCLKNHMRVHCDELPFSCHICRTQFGKFADVKAHMKIHSDQGQFKCSFCRHSFAQSVCLERHVCLGVRGENLYRCNECCETFATILQLKVHVVVHASAPVYACSVCKKEYRRTQTLAKHVLFHTSGKPFGCDTCQCRYKSSAVLEKHKCRGSRAPVCLRYRCNVCFEKFVYILALKFHVESDHKVESCRDAFVRDA